MALDRRTPPSDLGAGEARLEGRAVRYTLKRSVRARYARLEVRKETGLTVVVPRRFPLAQVQELLNAKRRWILSKLAQLERSAPPAEELRDGAAIPYLGRDLRVTIRRANGEAGGVALAGDRLLVTRAPQNGSVQALLESWYRTQAAKVLGARARQLGDALGVSFNRITIRGQKSRWGSCSRKGSLSFNWRLLMAPQAVVDYVVIHELAHLSVMDHSKRFWALVAEHSPQWREHRRWLKEHGPELAATLATIKP